MMSNEVVVATRLLNEELYRICEGFIDLDYPRKTLKGLEADAYLYGLLDLDCKWVVSLDEDAFLFNSQRIAALINYMSVNNYDCCGTPDGGVIQHRPHNPLAINPYFFILNVEKIRKCFDPESAAATKYSEDLKSLTPTHLLRHSSYQYDDFEVYYPFFFWLLKSGFRILYLNAYQWRRDVISTIQVDHENVAFLIHCWYARAYKEQQQRFQQAIAFAADIREQLKNPANTLQYV